MKYWEDEAAGVVLVSLRRGDDVLECIKQVVREAELTDGIVLTGIGSLSKGHFHVIASNNYPPGDTYVKLDGPLEIAQLGGIIGGGEPHLHLTLFDKAHRAYGGHLEPGCEVLTLCELSIRRLRQTRLQRRDVDGSGIKVLDAA